MIPLHSTNLLTVLDPADVVRYESPSIERVFGYRPDELVGEQVADYFHPDAPNDVAPSGYNAPDPVECLASSPLAPPADPRGLRWD